MINKAGLRKLSGMAAPLGDPVTEVTNAIATVIAAKNAGTLTPQQIAALVQAGFHVAEEVEEACVDAGCCKRCCPTAGKSS